MDANTTGNDTPVTGVDSFESDREAARRFFARVGTGFRVWNYDMRSAMAKVNSTAQWRTKRAKYGPTGRKRQDYSAWRKARGLPPVEETFDTDKEKP